LGTQSAQVAGDSSAVNTMHHSEVALHDVPHTLEVSKNSKVVRGHNIGKAEILLRPNRKVQNVNTKVIPKGITPEDKFADWAVLEHGRQSERMLSKPISFHWNWLPAVVAVVLLTLAICKSQEQKQPAWRRVRLLDSLFAQYHELRRKSAKAQGWDTHFPLTDTPSGFCHGIAYMEKLCSKTHVHDALLKLVEKSPRFGATFIKGKSWELVTKIDMDYHFVEHGPVSTQHLRDELIQAFLNKQAKIDPKKPLWRLHFICCETDDDALVFSYSHAIGDAVSVLPVVLECFGKSKNGKPFESVSEDVKKAVKAKLPGSITNYAYKIRNLIWNMTHLGSILQVLLFREAMASETRLPCHYPERYMEVPFSGPMSMSPEHQCLMNFPPIPINYVKTLKDKAKTIEGLENTTLNDVLFVAYMGTLRRYCEGVGKGDGSYGAILEPEKEIKGMVLRGCQLHNQEAMIKLAMGKRHEVQNTFELQVEEIGEAMGQATPRARLKKVVDVFGKNRAWGSPSPLSIVNSLLDCFMPLAILEVEELMLVLQHMQTKCTFTLSAMALPLEPVYVEGIVVKEIRVAYHSNVPGVMAVSYAGNVAMSVNICTEGLPGWEKMPALFIQEFRALGESLGVDAALLDAM
jgi:hypothetical protein